MKQVPDIKVLSGGLRSRLENDIINLLLFLENITKTECQSVVIERVFSDFTKVNDRIWSDLENQLMMLRREENKATKAQVRRRIC